MSLSAGPRPPLSRLPAVLGDRSPPTAVAWPAAAAWCPSTPRVDSGARAPLAVDPSDGWGRNIRRIFPSPFLPLGPTTAERRASGVPVTRLPGITNPHPSAKHAVGAFRALGPPRFCLPFPSVALKNCYARGPLWTPLSIYLPLTERKSELAAPLCGQTRFHAGL